MGAGTLLVFHPSDDVFFCHEAYFLADGAGTHRLAFVFRWLSLQRPFYVENGKHKLSQSLQEAQAERELLYSQREKQIAAAKKANREREVVMEASRGEGWEAVLNLISDENLVKDKNTDLGRFKQILTRLKHQKPLATM